MYADGYANRHLQDLWVASVAREEVGQWRGHFNEAASARLAH